MFNLSEITSKGYLDKIDKKIRKLRPNQIADLQRATQVQEKIRKQLSKKPPLNQADYQISGSLGKDTYIKSRDEFELVISLQDNLSEYPPNESSREDLMELIATELGIKNYYKTDLTLEYSKSGYNIDIVPSFKIDTNKFISLTNNDKKSYLGHMTLKHIEFVHNRGKKYQDLCRLIKYWVNGPANPDQDKYCSSFFVELLTADMFDRYESKKYTYLFESILRRFKNLKKTGSNGNKKYIAFDDFYSKKKYRKKWKKKLAVLDPINPTDNIATKSPQDENLDKLIKKARDTLKMWNKEGFEKVFNKYFT